MIMSRHLLAPVLLARLESPKEGEWIKYSPRKGDKNCTSAVAVPDFTGDANVAQTAKSFINCAGAQANSRASTVKWAKRRCKRLCAQKTRDVSQSAQKWQTKATRTVLCCEVYKPTRFDHRPREPLLPKVVEGKRNTVSENRSLTHQYKYSQNCPRPYFSIQPETNHHRYPIQHSGGTCPYN